MSELVLITGASAGIGQAVAERFAGQGHQVILTARRRERLEALAERLGPKATVHQLDVTDAEAVDRLAAELGPVSVLVNNAGCAHGMAPAWECALKDWLAMVELNINGLLRLTRAVLPGMVERNRGHIINLGSVAGTYPYPGGHVYGATKAFVEQFSLNLRCDLHGKNIRVTNIEPGMVETEFSLVRFEGDQEKADAVYQGFEPLTAEDIAEAVYWCASLPARVNINRLEVMPTMQSSAGFRVHRQ
ncbi:MAG: SDR family oxidoreductase [Candidatus Eremiobacteraeota bacterium]|nr:SDR family oxidoreductase [Candidatus Eremiobacteraeota bacterium]